MSKRAISGLVAAFLFAASGSSAMAGESGTAILHGGFKSEGTWWQVADGRSYWAGTYWGLSHNKAGSGFGHGMAWNCPALGEVANGVFSGRGYCIWTDRDGDKVFATFLGKAPPNEIFKGESTYTGGTGKYAGITGGHEFQCESVGTDEQFDCTQNARYALK